MILRHYTSFISTFGQSRKDVMEKLSEMMQLRQRNVFCTERISLHDNEFIQILLKFRYPIMIHKELFFCILLNYS